MPITVKKALKTGALKVKAGASKMGGVVFGIAKNVTKAAKKSAAKKAKAATRAAAKASKAATKQQGKPILKGLKQMSKSQKKAKALGLMGPIYGKAGLKSAKQNARIKSENARRDKQRGERDAMNAEFNRLKKRINDLELGLEHRLRHAPQIKP